MNVLSSGLYDCLDAQTGKKPPLIFSIFVGKGVFKSGEDVVLDLSIRNVSSAAIFVSRMTRGEFVDLELVGPSGGSVDWQGSGKIDRKSYSPADFVVLKTGGKVRAKRIISVKDGHGFVIAKPGRYTVRGTYSLEPGEYFTPLAGSATIPKGKYIAETSFCFEKCEPIAAR